MSQDLFQACCKANPHLNIQTLDSSAFALYGCTHKVAPEIVDQIMQELNKLPALQNKGEEVYKPISAELEALPCAEMIKNNLYGTVDCQIGSYIGRAFKLNAVEFHKCNEVLFVSDPIVVLLGHTKDLINHTYHTSKIEAFYVPAGTCIETYSSTLHFSPLPVTTKGVRMAVVQQRFTNHPFNNEVPKPAANLPEDALLLERNKWVVAHAEATSLIEYGAFVGLVGENHYLNTID